MSKIGQAISELQTLDDIAKRDGRVNRIHPLSKLLLTVFYITVTVSFGKYDLPGLIGMAVYPAAVFMIAGLSFGDAVRRLKAVLPFVIIMGIANPFFDREVFFYIGRVPVTGGVISMLTLMIKAILSVLAGYLLIATTSIEEICRAMRIIHIPKTFVVVVLLIYRYIAVLLAEARRITEAYSLRAPGQKGIHYKVWGPLLGQLLLRSMDRADALYESMLLRGFDGEFRTGKGRPLKAADILWPLCWGAVILLLRRYPAAELLGSLFI